MVFSRNLCFIKYLPSSRCELHVCFVKAVVDGSRGVTCSALFSSLDGRRVLGRWSMKVDLVALDLVALILVALDLVALILVAFCSSPEGAGAVGG